MDDLQFRRCIYANPHTDDAEVLAEIANDSQKLQFVKEMKAFDRQLEKALKVNVPEDLAERIILRQSLGQHQQQKRKSRIQLAIAASIAFAVGIAINLQSPTFQSVGEYALAHTHHEEMMFSNNMPTQITLAAANEKLTTYGAQMAQPLGKLISAGYCDFGGVHALHMVYQGENKPVTVYIIPKDTPFNFDTAFSDESLHGLAKQYPTANVIIVADKQESIASWQQKMEQAVRWST